MKCKITLFAVLFAFLFGFTAENTNAQEKTPYYIVFTNFEDLNLNIDVGEGETYPFDEAIYWYPLNSLDSYKPYLVKKPFGPATFAQRDITEYDVAVFPMGDQPLSANVGGIKVIDKINEMLEAGKSVIVIGRNILTMAQQDPSVSKLLFNDMRLDFQGRILTSEKEGSTTTYNRFDVHAIEGDPVGMGHNKVCNISYGENTDPEEPYAFYISADFFKIKNTSQAIGFDRVPTFQGDWWAGVRYITPDNSRFVLWTIGYEVAARTETDEFEGGLISAFDWCTETLPKPEQYIEAEKNTIDFKAVKPGDSLVKEVRIRNSGREDLTITETEIENFFSEEGIYTIVQNNISPDNPKVIEPNQFITIKIKFKPKTNKTYNDAILIHSDAINSKNLTIAIKGSGGEQEDIGPMISTFDFPIDFGEIKTGGKVVKPIDFTNTGTAGLSITNLIFTDDADNSFLWDGELKTPITIQPGNTEHVKVRFFPLEAGKTYNGQLLVVSTAKNADSMYIDLIGKTKENKAGPEAEYYIPKSGIDFGDVVTTKDTTIWIKSVGDENLYVSADIEGDNENKQAFEILSESQGSVAPGDSFRIDLRFKPALTKFYFATLSIITNGKVYDDIDIDIAGNGIVSVNDNGEAVLPGIFKMKVSPNPVKDASLLEYTVNTNSRNHLNLYLVDEAGNTVHTFKDGTVPAGTNQLTINTNKYSSGTYYIMAEIGGERTVLPLVIAK